MKISDQCKILNGYSKILKEEGNDKIKGFNVVLSNFRTFLSK